MICCFGPQFCLLHHIHSTSCHKMALFFLRQQYKPIAPAIAEICKAIKKQNIEACKAQINVQNK